MKNAKKIDVKIHQLNNKNQFVIKHNEMFYFQSYDSLVAALIKNKVISYDKNMQ